MSARLEIKESDVNCVCLAHCDSVFVLQFAPML